MSDVPEGFEYKPGRTTEKQQIQNAKVQVEREALKKAEAQAISRAFSTPDGIRALTAIMVRCCYQSEIPVTSSTGLDVNGMIHNAALHKHYLWLRNQIDKETLIQVENR